MNEKESNAIEDLAYIRQIIMESKNTVVDNGQGFIFWGFIVFIGLMYTYLDIFNHFPIENIYIWTGLISLGWIYSIVTNWKHFRRKKVSTLAGKLIGATWFSAGIVMIILSFIGTLSNAYGGVYISPLISTVLGMAFMISGILLNYKWVSYLCVLWWAGAIYMFVYPTVHTILLMSIMMLCLQILPGIIILKKSKNKGVPA